MERAAIAIGAHGVRDAHADYARLAVRRLRGDGASQLRASGIGVAEGHYVVAARGHARDENGSLIGFGARTGEKALLQSAGSDLRDFFGEGDNLLVGIESGKMLEAVHLGLDLRRDFGVAVADGDRQDAAEEIEVFAPFDIPDVLHLGAVGDERLLVVVGHG